MDAERSPPISLLLRCRLVFHAKKQFLSLHNGLVGNVTVQRLIRQISTISPDVIRQFLWTTHIIMLGLTRWARGKKPIPTETVRKIRE